VGFYFIGEQEILTGFRFVGVDGEAVADEKTALAAFAKATAVGTPWRVLILTEQAALWLGDALTDWQLTGGYPLTVEIPGISGHRSDARSLVAQIREAIGIQV
jgi:V/A-type H+-transporting ATPase subunit F